LRAGYPRNLVAIGIEKVMIVLPSPRRFRPARGGTGQSGGRERFMKKHNIIFIALILIPLIGVSVLLYPFVGKYLNTKSQSRAVTYYLDDVKAMDDSDMQAVLDAAHAYNRNLLQNQNRFEFTDHDTAEYKRQLNTGRDIMGVLVIDKIDVKLSIYHGTDQGVLQVGLGHMQGTSLPVGGIGTHSFITGHRGVPSATLLTELGKMTEGDTFTIYVMGETLTYEIDDIQTVTPYEIEKLDIDPDMDYCTLVTCTPYGINTHRLLVRGHRTENAADSGWETLFAEAKWLDKLMVILLFMVPVLPALIIILIISCRRIYISPYQRH